ncbi:MAG: hypothetical protein JOZ90_00620 [Alphaproteobacteria bacterium]|nr:hypothetical protein [Alphaproteobacteria bacterium]MBV9372288.1 hypothetical protein [Alphaproteobacteria bacterium]MBV9899580.1 hypothetical protein [Alphaproteobacteria bacterium]
MDPNHVSAFAGVLGAAVGGLTSFGTTWIAQEAQFRQQQRETARRQREALFVKFMNEAGRLYADALSHEKDDIADIVQLYAIVAHLRMVSGQAIVGAAERVVHAIVEAYQAPNRALHEIGDLAGSEGMIAFRELGLVFRAELAEFGLPSSTPADHRSAPIPTYGRADRT